MSSSSSSKGARPPRGSIPDEPKPIDKGIAQEQGREPSSLSQEDFSAYESRANPPPEEITDALFVEEIDTDLYRSKTLWQPSRARGVFGGQVIGQSLIAASKTVRDGLNLHSLHCYFLLAGKRDIPIIYHVTRVRDGGSYITRLVQAKQHGRTIFLLMCSYQKPEPDQPSFAIELPRAEVGQRISWDDQHSANNSSEGAPEAATVQASRFARSGTPDSIIAALPSPLDCPLNEERYIRVLREQGDNVPESIKKILQGWIRDRQQSPVEIRDAHPGMYDENGLPTPGAEQAFWMRSRQPIQGGESAAKAALAYASDFYLLSTVPKALGNSPNIGMMASLDHSMHFYESKFSANEWILFLMQTQAASNGRGVVLGRMYREDGTLIAVVSQEGLVRERRPKSLSSKL
ncbi:acyl-CoA thioesterase [Tilletia horrida]|uniref:Acyl-CoA thioesterase n=1 Tax=Tilletia horrida TaxID=155126 RepID=A0AAN6JNI1_9BASI|nr:acyl-CoA thioesterase [Tilletia horrida]